MSKQRIEFTLGFKADTAQAQRELESLAGSLKKLAIQQPNVIDDKQFKEATQAAFELQQHLQKAVDVDTGKLDLTKFSKSLKDSGKDLNSYSIQLQKLGPEGKTAFNQLTRSIAAAEVPTLKLNKHLESFLITLKNTAKWQLTSNITHGLESALSHAYTYAQNLNESLTNISIVTSKSTEEMARFAQEANKTAKALSSSTTGYTDASLIYFQQGLSEKEVEERTKVTVKMANVTGQSVETISEQLTSVWNNFDDGTKSLEYYADVLARLGADTASSSDEIVQGLQKFSSVADTIGLSYEYAAASLATITSTTRESADVVGTALKTLFSRIQGLKLGETLEDGVDLNKYSEALDKVGVKVLDQNNELREMDVILNELGAKWNTIGKAEQTALAQTVAGVRQYTQLMTLMNNWDQVQVNVQKGLNSEGSLQEQQDIYAAGWEASAQRVQTALESIYDTLINDEFFIELNNFLADALEGVNGFVKGMGGIPGILSSVSGILLTVFAKQMPNTLNKLTDSFRALFGYARKDTANLQQQAQNILDKKNPNLTQSEKLEREQLSKLLKMKSKLTLEGNKLTEAERESYEIEIQKTQLVYNQLITQQKIAEELEKQTKQSRSSIVNGLANAQITNDETTQEYIKAIQSRAQIKKEIEEMAKGRQEQFAKYENDDVLRTSQSNDKIEGSTAQANQARADRSYYNKNKEAIDAYLTKKKEEKRLEEQIVQLQAKRLSYDKLTKQAKTDLKPLEDMARAQGNIIANYSSLRQQAEVWSDSQEFDIKEVTTVLKQYIATHEQLATAGNADKDQIDYWDELKTKLENGELSAEDLKAELIAIKEMSSEDFELEYLSKGTSFEEKITEFGTTHGGEDKLPQIREHLDLTRQQAAASREAAESQDRHNKSGEKFVEHSVEGVEALSSLTGSLMTFYSTLSSVDQVVKSFSNPDTTGLEKFGAIISLIVSGVQTYGSTLKATSDIMTYFSGKAKKAGKDANELTETIVAVGSGAKVMKQGTEGAAKGVSALSKAMKTAAVWILAIEVVIMAVSAAVSIYTEHNNKIIESNKEVAESAREEANALRESRQSNTDLIQQMDAALKEYQKTGKNKEELDRITEQLAETYNLEGAAIAQLTGQYDDYFRFLQKTNQAKRDELKLEQQKTQIAIEKQGKALEKSNITSVYSGLGATFGTDFQSTLSDLGILYAPFGEDKNTQYLSMDFLNTQQYSNRQNEIVPGTDVTYGESNKITENLLKKYGFSHSDLGNMDYWQLYNVEDTIENRIKLYQMLVELNEALGGTHTHTLSIIKSFEDSGIKELIADQEYLRSVQLFTGDIPEIQELIKQEGKNSIDAWTEDLGSVDEYENFVNQIRKTLEDSGKYTKEEIDKAINNIIDYSSNSDLRDFKAVSDLLEDRASRLPKTYGDTLKQSLSKEDLKEWYNKLTDKQKDLVPSLNFDIVYDEEQLNQQLHLAQLQLDNANLTTQVEAGINAIDVLSKGDWAAFAADKNLWGEDGLMTQAGYKFTDFYNQYTDNSIEALAEILLGQDKTGNNQGIFNERRLGLEAENKALSDYQEELQDLLSPLEKIISDNKISNLLLENWKKVQNAYQTADIEETVSAWDNYYQLLDEFNQNFGIDHQTLSELATEVGLNSESTVEDLNNFINAIRNKINQVDDEIEANKTEIIVNAEMEPGYIDKITKAIEGIKVEPLEVPITPVIEGRFLQSDAVISGLESYINGLKTELESPTITSDRKMVEGLIQVAEKRLQTERNNQIGEAEKYRDFDINAADKFFSTFSFERITSATDKNGNQIIGSVFGDGNGNIWISDGKGGSKQVSLTERDAVTGTYNYAQIVSDSLEAEKTSRINIYNEKFAGKTETEEAKAWYNKYIQPIQNLIEDVLLYTGNVSASTQNVYNKQAAASNKPDEKSWESPIDYDYSLRGRFETLDENVNKALEEYDRIYEETMENLGELVIEEGQELKNAFEDVLNSIEAAVTEREAARTDAISDYNQNASQIGLGAIDTTQEGWQDSTARLLENKREEIELKKRSGTISEYQYDQEIYYLDQIEKAYKEILGLDEEITDLDKQRIDFLDKAQKEAEDAIDSIEKERDVYLVINRQLDLIGKELDRIAKKRAKAYGQSYLDTFDEEVKLLRKQNEALLQKIEIAKQQVELDKVRIQSALLLAGINIQAQFDAQNNLINLGSIMDALYQKVEDLNIKLQQAIKECNDAAIAFYTEQILFVQNAIGSFETALSSFHSNLDIISSSQFQIEDNLDRELEINYERVEYALELRLNINENDLKLLEFYLGRIEDDFYSAAEAGQLLLDKIPKITEGLQAHESFYYNIKDLFAAGQINAKDYADGLQKSFDGVLSNIEALDELDKKMLDYYGDTLNMAMQEMDHYTSGLEHLTSVLDHYKNIITLINGETDYDKIGKILDAQATTLKNELDVSEATYKMLLSQQKLIEEEYARAVTPEHKEMVEKKLKAINEAVNEAQEEMLSKTEAWAEALKAVAENAMEKAFKEMEKAFTDGMGFDALNDSMEQLSSYQEIFLTKTNQVYEVQKMMRTAQQAADRTDNANAKKRINNFIQETKKLQDKNKLSHLELEIQQAQYDLLLAQIALEEAQNAKTTVRLRRDSEGNFGYVYTGDQMKISEAEQNLADAENALYNISLNATNEWGQKRIELQQQLAEELEELERRHLEGEFATTEEYNIAKDRILQKYYENAAIYSEQYAIAIKADTQAEEDAWVNAYQNMMDKTQDWEEIVGTCIDSCETAFTEWKDTVQSESQIVDDLLNNTETAIGDVVTKSDELKDKALEVVGALDSELTAVQSLTEAYGFQRAEIQLMIDAYAALAQEIQNTLAMLAGADFSGGLNVKPSVDFDPTVDYSQLMAQHILMGGSVNDIEYQRLMAQRDAKYASNPEKYKDVLSNETISNFLDAASSNDKNIAAQIYMTGLANGSAYYNKGLMDGALDSINSASGQAKGQRDYILEAFDSGNRQQTEQYITDTNNFRVFAQAAGEYGYSYSQAEQMYKNEYIQQHPNYEDEWIEPKDWLRLKNSIASGDTGLYTGSWGSGGKLLMAHEKELLLNPSDTTNILLATGMLRDISEMIDLNAASNLISQGLSSGSFSNILGGKEELEQNVTIEAHFHDATTREEITAAFNTLINTASQYANRKTK